MVDPTIDLATFEELQHTAGSDFVKELIDAFLEEAPRMIDELSSAITARDAERFRRAAHSLKSNSLTFGARALGAMARDLELQGLSAKPEADTKRLEALSGLYARVAVALKGLRDD